MPDAAARALLQQLLRTIDDEGAALADNDLARLDALVQRKQQLIQQLAPLLRAMNPEDRPLQALRDAARRNAANGTLLAPRLRATRAGLAALGLDASAGTYAQHGAVTSSAAPRPVRASA